MGARKQKSAQEAKFKQTKLDFSQVKPKAAPKVEPETPPSNTSEVFIKSEHRSSPDRTVPSVLYAEDGGIFYPCSHCCRAFRDKPEMEQHLAICTLGRTTPSPFKKHSDKENCEKSDSSKEVNNNAKISRKKKRSKDKKLNVKRKRCGSPNTEINIINTKFVCENINNLTENLRNKVLENISQTLKENNITVLIPEGDDPIVVETIANGKHPAMRLTSRNLDTNSVEIKTKVIDGSVKPKRLPDISAILEANFGLSKPPERPPNRPESPENDDVTTEQAKSVKSVALKSIAPKSIHHESIVDDSEFGDIMLDDEDLEGNIVLEDLDIHICKQCGSVYRTLQDLLTHDKYEHRNVKKRYPPNELYKYNVVFQASNNTTCPICFRQMANKTAWPRHLQTHSDIPNFECTICGKKFTRNDHRKIHESRHEVLPEKASPKIARKKRTKGKRRISKKVK